MDLVAGGVTEFHFYTLNRANLVYAICHLHWQLRPAPQAQPQVAAPAARSKDTRMNRNERIAALHKAAAERILILDGAMGTMIQRHKLREADYRGERFKDWPSDLKGNNDLLVLTQPDIIRGIHEAYLDAGADIVETNTFNAQTISMADYGMEALAFEINVAAAKLAREAADKYTALTPHKPRFVAGADRPDKPHRVAFARREQSRLPQHNLRRACRRLQRANARADRRRRGRDPDRNRVRHAECEGGGFAVKETFDTLGLELPIMISGTVTDLSGRKLSGQTPEAFWYSLRHLKPFSIGMNCSFGAEPIPPASRANLKGCRYLSERLRQCRPAQRDGRI